MYRLQREFRRRLADTERELIELRERATAPGLTMQQAETLHLASTQMQARLEQERKVAQVAREEAEKLRLAVGELEVKNSSLVRAAITLLALTSRDCRRSCFPCCAPVACRHRLRTKQALCKIPRGFASVHGNCAWLRSLALQLAFGMGVLDKDEYELRLKQQVMEWNRQVKELKLTDLKLTHQVWSLNVWHLMIRSNRIAC